ncbi:hypothetical protein SAMN03080617_00798 [Algoriphagus alkaliphilus]|uniref:Lipoprotein n=1 Tax=Algoriphagus alkaliphilus TaxID=279824 RepID=A0A1G5VZT3_9BACT|nr:dirigent protein [Algoriphagus alkaliphilus]MBA4301586.1 hypothetical protein [Cyclobacterium sp.]SDA51359.1 hypothetical protein SAMN03080617_00798 [Algoriphagus alkaliphilus]
MKQIKLKLSGLVLISGIIFSSCMSEAETPVINELAEVSRETSQVVTGEENFRKGPKGVFYQEKFSNQSIVVGNPAAFPGFGEGQATFIGKGFSFFNQYALGFPDQNGVVFTEPAWVTEFFEKELIALGIDAEVIKASSKIVSSLTTDGKGNSIWFKSVSNRAQFDQQGNITFEAEIEIVGGTGKFQGATGVGTVKGNVMASDGKGNTTVRANIVF